MIIGVLGRGPSLKRYKKYHHLMDKIYIVGNFKKEIKALGKEYFVGKDIVQVVGRGHLGLSEKMYKKLNINSVQTICHKLSHFVSGGGKKFKKHFPPKIELKTVPKCMVDRGYPPLPLEILNKNLSKFDNYKDMCNFLEKKYANKKELWATRRVRYWPQTGSYAIDLALTVNNPDEIYLFGIDRYQDPDLYFTSYKGDFEETRHTMNTDFCLYHIGSLAKEYPKTKFHSGSKYLKFDYSNWDNVK